MQARLQHTIRFDAPGDTRWDVQVSWEQGDGAKGAFSLPIFIYNRGDGPTVLLSGGVHGDEYEGPSCLWEMVLSGGFDTTLGRVIVIPVMNPPALAANTRRSPLDDQDMNRSFPGSKAGSPTDVIAHFISTQVIPEVDFVFDLHAAGHRFTISPSIMTLAIEDRDLHAQSLEAISASGLPVVLSTDELNDIGMIDAEVLRQGKVFGCAELGSGGELTPTSHDMTKKAVRNLLRYTGNLHSDAEPITWQDSAEQRYVRIDSLGLSTAARFDGLFLPSRTIEESVRKGQEVGHLITVDTADAADSVVTAAADGLVYNLSAGGFVEAGDDLVTIAKEFNNLASLLADLYD